MSQIELRLKTRTFESRGVICLPPRMRRIVDFTNTFAPMRRQRIPLGRVKLRLLEIFVDELESTTAELSGNFSFTTSRARSLTCLTYHYLDADADGSRRKGSEAQLSLEL